jgi:2-iminobutanoate/2-iminopropanoate deaminase
MIRILGSVILLTVTSAARALPVTHYPAATAPFAEVGAPPPYSAAVLAGDTLYVAGSTDADAAGKPAPDATTAALRILDKMKGTVERAGMTMNDLVWVQVFATNLADYNAFNTVYRGYFTGPMPTRAFIGAGNLLGGAHFEVMGIAVKAK